MSYLVLARKYRPRTFSQVVGQETAMRTLQGAIEEQRVGHAYLFCGPRGTGKTTTARIVAKALICEQGPTPEPCGVCAHCRDTDAGSHVDVIEMDAASNRGIDDARELRERVAYAPMRARFKVFIIDEVHQLTKEAFNALLKTLEEPPAHVKFLFATTELEKVIETVRSRCQIVRLSLISEERIAAHLDQVLASENVQPEAGVTAELGRLARGSLRDALSITDQLLALVGDKPALADVRRVAPQGHAEQVDALLAAIERGERAEMLAALPKTEGGEADLCNALLAHLRLALLCRLCPNDAALFESDPAQRTRLAERATRLGADKLQIWLEELLHARERMALLPQQARIVLEVTLLDLCRSEASLPLALIEERLMALEQRLSSGAPPRPSAAPAPSPSAVPAREFQPAPASSSDGRERAAPAATPPSSAHARAAFVLPTPPSARPQPTTTVAAPPRTLPSNATPSSATPLHATPSHATPGNSGSTATISPPRSGFSAAASTTATWNALLADLATSQPALCEALRRRGQLVDLLGGRATIQLTRATDAERALISSAESIERCMALLSRVLARPTKVVIDDPATRAAGASDPFTRSVAELFAGQIEDNG